jgi:hypothetical protein
MEELYINDVSFLHKDKKKVLKKFIQKDGVDIHFVYDSEFHSAKILRDYIEVLSVLV